MNRRILFLIALLLLSPAAPERCSDKEVLLPVIEVDGVPETQNHSSIWIFYDPSGTGSKAVLNKNNKPDQHHWIFNIDRRLTMKDVIPLLLQMQEDRNKDSMHKKEGMLNFFSYADSENERLSLVPFPQTSFIHTEDPNLNQASTDECIVLVKLAKMTSGYGGSPSLWRISPKFILIPAFGAPEETPVFRMAYDEELSFQRYLETRAHFAASGLPTDTTELVDTLK